MIGLVRDLVVQRLVREAGNCDCTAVTNVVRRAPLVNRPAGWGLTLSPSGITDSGANRTTGLFPLRSYS